MSSQISFERGEGGKLSGDSFRWQQSFVYLRQVLGWGDDSLMRLERMVTNPEQFKPGPVPLAMGIGAAYEVYRRAVNLANTNHRFAELQGDLLQKWKILDRAVPASAPLSLEPRKIEHFGNELWSRGGKDYIMKIYNKVQLHIPFDVNVRILPRPFNYKYNGVEGLVPRVEVVIDMNPFFKQLFPGRGPRARLQRFILQRNTFVDAYLFPELAGGRIKVVDHMVRPDEPPLYLEHKDE